MLRTMQDRGASNMAGYASESGEAQVKQNFRKTSNMFMSPQPKNARTNQNSGDLFEHSTNMPADSNLPHNSSFMGAQSDDKTKVASSTNDSHQNVVVKMPMFQGQQSLPDVRLRNKKMTNTID